MQNHCDKCSYKMDEEKCKHLFWRDRNPPNCMNCGKTEEELTAISCFCKCHNPIVTEDELTDMFGEGGKEEVKEYYGLLESKGVAYYRLTKDMKEFFEKCEEEYGILGFEWDGSFNFGVILKK